MGDANVTKPALLLPVAHRCQLGGNIDQIVDLHQVDALGSQPGHRALHRFNSGLLAARPNFGGEKKLVAQSELARESADHLLGPAIHWRGVDHAAAQLHEERKHIAELLFVVRIQIHIEDVPGSKSDDGELLARRWNHPRQHR